MVHSLELDDLVTSLPNGIDTIIGENGSILSGGKKQRVSIARAMIRNPDFIIFDESTSALDNETENCINDIIKKLSLKTIVLIIAHKKSALCICKKVYEIENRKFIEYKD